MKLMVSESRRLQNDNENLALGSNEKTRNVAMQPVVANFFQELSSSLASH